MARFSSRNLETDAAASLGEAQPFSHFVGIFVFKKTDLRETEGKTRATPSLSMPGWKSTCEIPAASAFRNASSAPSSVKPAVLSASVGKATFPASFHVGMFADAASAAGAGAPVSAAAPTPSSAERRSKRGESGWRLAAPQNSSRAARRQSSRGRAAERVASSRRRSAQLTLHPLALGGAAQDGARRGDSHRDSHTQAARTQREHAKWAPYL